jgi:hypothetical protein
MKHKILQMMLAVLVCAEAQAQVNSGSNGSDGAFNPAIDTVINMADHPNGIYQYTSVTISNGVTVTFIPNVNNTPVTWLVQSNVVINGTVILDGTVAVVGTAGIGGPGGYRGGNTGTTVTSGQGPGGGAVGTGNYGGNASYGTLGATNVPGIGSPGSIYGNNFLIPLLGGSGGGGSVNGYAGGGGGGGILIAASNPGSIQLNGRINAVGSPNNNTGVSAGSGGAVRLVATTISGTGSIYTHSNGGGGNGRVRFDSYFNNFTGNLNGAVFSQGLQFVVIPAAGSGTQLTIASVAGVPVSASPTGLVTTPDAVISALQSNPVSVVVQCSNIPLSTAITVTVTTVSGTTVSAVGYNNSGSLGSSTASISITVPRGGGYISASAATGN